MMMPGARVPEAVGSQTARGGGRLRDGSGDAGGKVDEDARRHSLGGERRSSRRSMEAERQAPHACDKQEDWMIP